MNRSIEGSYEKGSDEISCTQAIGHYRRLENNSIMRYINCYSSSNVISTIISNGMKWTCNVDVADVKMQKFR
jgi:hypothetical protein